MPRSLGKYLHLPKTEPRLITLVNNQYLQNVLQDQLLAFELRKLPRLGDTGFPFRQWQQIFLFRKVQAGLRPRSPPVQWVSELFHFRVKWPWGKADNLPPFSNNFKGEWSNNSVPPIRLHCMFKCKLTRLLSTLSLSEILGHSRLFINQNGA